MNMSLRSVCFNDKAKLLILGKFSSDRLSGFPNYQMFDYRDFSEFLHSYRSKNAFSIPRNTFQY